MPTNHTHYCHPESPHVQRQRFVVICMSLRGFEGTSAPISKHFIFVFLACRNLLSRCKIHNHSSISHSKCRSARLSSKNNVLWFYVPIGHPYLRMVQIIEPLCDICENKLCNLFSKRNTERCIVSIIDMFGYNIYHFLVQGEFRVSIFLTLMRYSSQVPNRLHTVHLCLLVI